jgi:von Willebrand factor type A domain
MNKFTRKKKQQWRDFQPGILSFVIIMAFLAHIWGIYLLKDLKIKIYPSKPALMERQGVLKDLTRERLQTNEEKVKREEQLAVVFSELLRQAKEIQSTHYDFKSLKTDIVPPKPLEITLDFDDEKNDDFIDTDVDLMLVEDVICGWEAEVSDISTSSNQKHYETPAWLMSTSKGVVQELISATEKLQSQLEISTSEALAAVHSIRVGSMENASLEGNALKNQLGAFDSDMIHFLHSEEASMVPGTTDFLSSLNPLIDFSTSKKEKVFPLGIHQRNRVLDITREMAVASSDDFTLRVEYAPKQNASGYLFRIELAPKEGIVFKKIKQNVFFLIDRSHSIREKRYEASKEAVMSALNCLHLGDTFNIFVFDDHVSQMAHQNVPWSSRAVAEACEFLVKQKYGGFFATTDLYSSLGNIIPDVVAENEVNTAILLSDGDTYLSSDKQRETIGKWTQRNFGKVSLYSVASGSDNNLALLDLLSTFNQGALHYARDDRSLGSVLLELMTAIRNPIGKEIVVTAVAPSEDMQIVIYPTIMQRPHLFQDVPYVICGYINKLSDFSIFFQGKYYDKWFDIKQNVNFNNAKKCSGDTLERLWAKHLAYDFYRRYLLDGNINHLSQARQVLAPFKILPAFQ